MSYAKSVLQPNEQLVLMGRLHWIIYSRAILYLTVGAVLVWIAHQYWNDHAVTTATAALTFCVFVASFFYAWFIRWITEFTVTDRRVIYKQGFIYRRTVEMNMDKVETVDVNQSVLGRILDYGTIHVRGTGQGIEHLHRIASPLAIRNAIVAK